MHLPRELRDAANQTDDIAVTRRENEGLVVVDFGPAADASLDRVGDTAIVVAGDRQFEFDVPTDVSELEVNDGMLLIRD